MRRISGCGSEILWLSLQAPSPRYGRSATSFAPRARGVFPRVHVGCWTACRQLSLRFVHFDLLCCKMEGFACRLFICSYIHPPDTDYHVPGTVLNEHSLTVIGYNLEVTRPETKQNGSVKACFASPGPAGGDLCPCRIC